MSPYSTHWLRPNLTYCGAAWAQALQAECGAMRNLGARVEAENLQLVDNMCDMTGENA